MWSHSSPLGAACLEQNQSWNKNIKRQTKAFFCALRREHKEPDMAYCNEMFYKTWQLINLRGGEIHVAASQRSRRTYSVKQSIMSCAQQMLIGITCSSHCRAAKNRCISTNHLWVWMLIFIQIREINLLMFVSRVFFFSKLIRLYYTSFWNNATYFLTNPTTNETVLK